MLNVNGAPQEAIIALNEPWDTSPLLVWVKAQTMETAARVGRKTRIYVDVAPYVPAQQHVKSLYPTDDEGHVNYTVRGDFPEVDRAFDVANREQTKLWRDVATATLAAVWADNDVKLTYSKKAGCSCGCSPGLIADGSWGLDVWISVHRADNKPSGSSDDVTS